MTQERRFDMTSGQGFLLSNAGEQITMSPKPHVAGEDKRLAAVLSNQEGTPFRVLQ